MAPARALAFARAELPRYVLELAELVRFPTVSSQPRHAPDLQRCAAWLADHLRRIGLDRARVVPTAGHPLVVGEWLRAPGRPTLLVYGHYDVQPAEPLDEWRSPPFEPVVRGDDIYGRGTSDDKGQLLIHLKAIEALLRTNGRLPVNVHVLLEGEEETAGESVERFMRASPPAADVAVVSDTRMRGPGRPAITYAMRGLLALEVELHGPREELHSGQFGGAVYNPMQAVCELVAGLHDASHRIAVPGFYARVRPLSLRERAEMLRAGPSDAEILAAAEAERGWAERGLTLYEETTTRPSLSVTGIAGGYAGPGVKSIVPPSAAAKLSFRLVPDQTPREVEALLRRHVAHVTPPGLRSSVRTVSRARSTILDRNHPALRAAAAAYKTGFGVAPVFLRSGGTIPIVAAFRETLGIPTVLMGFALPDDAMHAPNEKFHLPNLARGVATSISFMSELANAPLASPARPLEAAYG